MKYYEVIVNFEPGTFPFKRLKKPKIFKHNTQEEVLEQASYLRKKGLENRHFDIYAIETHHSKTGLRQPKGD